MKITFLGTSAMLPTATRNHTAILLEYKQEGILIDCGEGTQKQLRLAKINPNKITKILITHFHGDHVLGIPGIIQNLSAHHYQSTLEIYIPKGTKKYLQRMLSGVIFAGKIPMKVVEVQPGVFYKSKEFTLKAAKLSHGVDCLGYLFIEQDKRKINLAYTKKFSLTQHPLLGKLQQGKTITYEGKKITPAQGTIKQPGKKIAFILDTKLCKSAITLAKDTDLVIADATWLTDNKEKKGHHMTATEAAELAKKAKAKQLILTHFSQRYKENNEFEKEAKKVFKNVKAAEDFLTLTI